MHMKRVFCEEPIKSKDCRIGEPEEPFIAFCAIAQVFVPDAEPLWASLGRREGMEETEGQWTRL